MPPTLRPGRLVQSLLAALVILLAVLSPAAPAATSGSVTVYVFWAKGCPHCEKALVFLRRQQQADPSIDLQAREIRGDAKHRAHYFELSRHHRIANPGVPLIVIGDQVSTGYYDDASTGRALLDRIAFCQKNGCPDTVDAPAGAAEASASAAAAVETTNAANSSGRAGSLNPAQPPRPTPTLATLPKTLDVPLVGTVTLADLSLPALTVLLAAIDGFNPCAMWTLVFLIGLLLGLGDRFRMWLLGGTFIAGSAAVYFLFLSAWLNTLLAFSDVGWLRGGIALVALAGGVYYLKRFFAADGDSCPVTAPQSRRQVFERLRKLTSEPSLLLAMAGILALAFLVNLVELVCSAGIPAIYTQLLAMHALSDVQYYGYLLLYIFVFMLDDLFVFVMAMSTLHLAGIGSRYVRLANLLGGVILLLIGLAMMFRPHWLTLG